MQHVLQNSQWPDWQAASARRLNVSMLLATLLVAAVLSVLRFPTIDFLAPVMELVVDIVRDEPAKPELVSVPQPEPAPLTEEPLTDVEPALQTTANPVTVSEDLAVESQSTPAAVAELSIEWEVEKQKAVQRAVDEMERTVSVNPNFDQLRKEAAVKFRASRAPVRKEIWENVEKDVLGRTILRSGDCFRVLDDPSVINQWTFANFDQFITYCTYHKYIGHDLPWVQEIFDTHAYLREREDRRNGIFETE
jgi:hypothetical protein